MRAVNLHEAPEANASISSKGRDSVRDAHLAHIAELREGVIVRLAARGFRYQDIEDGFSDVILHITRRPEIVPDAWSFTWLLVIVRNSVLGILRHRKSHGGQPVELPGDDLLSDHRTDIADQIEETERQETDQQITAMLPQLIAELPPHLARTAELIVNQRMSNRDAAKVLGVNEGNVLRRIDRVVEVMHSALSRKGILHCGETEPAPGKYSKTIRPKRLVS